MYWISVFLVFFRNFFFNINPQLLFCFTNFTASQEKRESQRAGPVVRSSCFHYYWIPTGLLLIKESGFWLKPYVIFFRPDHRGLQRLSLEDPWGEAALPHGTWPSQCTLASEGSHSQGLGTPSWQWQGSDTSLHFQPRHLHSEAFSSGPQTDIFSSGTCVQATFCRKEANHADTLLCSDSVLSTFPLLALSPNLQLQGPQNCRNRSLGSETTLQWQRDSTVSVLIQLMFTGAIPGGKGAGRVRCYLWFASCLYYCSKVTKDLKVTFILAFCLDGTL